MITNQGREIPSLGGFAYRAQRFLDAGSKMSDILLAVDGRNRPVVLKIACVDQRARAEVNRLAIRNSVEWLRRLGRHRGLIALRAIEQTDAPWWRAWRNRRTCCGVLAHWPEQPEFMVMDHLAGGSLRDYVDGNRLDLELSLWIAHHIARTLAYVHSRGCVHRDVKPENILFRVLPDENANPASIAPILIDFGVAARTGEERLVSGSRLWMAPELQAAYERRPLPVDPAWDVYALGLILCYMIGGRRPRLANYDDASYERLRQETFACVDRELDDRAGSAAAANMRIKQLIDKTLAKNPAERITAQAFAEESARLLAKPGSPPGFRRRILMSVAQKRRLLNGVSRQVGLAVAALLVLCLLVLVSFATQRGLFFAGFGMPASDPSVHAAATGDQAAMQPALSEMATNGVAPNALAAANGAVPDAGRPQEIAPTPASIALAVTEDPTALPPAPTLALRTPQATPPAPTRVVLTATATDPPPTLAIPSPTATATEAAPTPAPPTATPRAQPTNTVRPTARQTPTRRPTATPTTAAAVAPLGRVQLLGPEDELRSDQARVEFRWQITQQPLGGDHCFEMVFWDPANAADRRSPVGASKSTTGRVDFNALANTPDPLLSRLAQSNEEFHWGVRLVSCVSSRTVLREVEEERVYTYDGQ